MKYSECKKLIEEDLLFLRKRKLFKWGGGSTLIIF